MLIQENTILTTTPLDLPALTMPQLEELYSHKNKLFTIAAITKLADHEFVAAMKDELILLEKEIVRRKQLPVSDC